MAFSSQYMDNILPYLNAAYNANYIPPMTYGEDLLTKYLPTKQPNQAVPAPGVGVSVANTGPQPVQSPAPTAAAAPASSADALINLLTTAINATPPKPSADAEKKAVNSQLDSTFGTDYGQRNIASTLLDDTINSILEEQKNSAASYLERGKARGIYNDVGYNAGVSGLGAAAEAGRSKLYDLGHSVIDKYRSDANAVRDKAYSAASAWTPGEAFSLDPYINEGNEVINRAKTYGAGDLRNAFGGTKLFDFSSLNNRAGQAQGAYNARDLDIVGALSARKRANAFGRGLGSQGAF